MLSPDESAGKIDGGGVHAVCRLILHRAAVAVCPGVAAGVYSEDRACSVLAPAHQGAGRRGRRDRKARRRGVSSAPLLNDLIRPQEQRRRDGEAERLRGFEVDDQFELRGLLDWQVGGLGTMQDLDDIGRSLS